MNKKRLGAFIFLFAILIVSLSLVSAVDSDMNNPSECPAMCATNNFKLSGSWDIGDKAPNAEKINDCEAEDNSYYRSYTDYYKEGDTSKTRKLYCCCLGEATNLAGTGGTNPFTTEGGGLIDILGLSPDGLFKWLSTWESGTDVSTIFIKYLLLVLVFILAYSSFNIVKFPEEPYLRAILSVVMAILFTIVIKPEELIAAMINFKSVGLTMILVFPMIVLAMFSFAMAVQVNAMGIVLQRVIWGIYSIFLFINSGLVLLAKKGTAAPDSILASLSTLANAFGGSYFTASDPTIATALFVASIIIFFTMVMFNKKFIALLLVEVREAKKKKYEDISEKSEAKKKVDAKAIDNA